MPSIRTTVFRNFAIFGFAIGAALQLDAAAITGAALGCFPDPNYPVPRPPQCVGGTGLANYTETGGPDRDFQYFGSTFDQVGSGTFNVNLGTLTLVGAGIASRINDTLHLSSTFADQYGEIGTAEYLISVTGFAFYDPTRMRPIGEVTIDFGNPQIRSFRTPAGTYQLTLNVPANPFVLGIPQDAPYGNGRVSYQIQATLALVDAPEPGTLWLLAAAIPILLVVTNKRLRCNLNTSCKV